MKLKILNLSVIFLLFVAGSCQLSTPEPETNRMYFEVDGKPYQFKNVVVEKTTMYSDDSENWYKVSAYSDVIKADTKEKYFAAFYFENKPDGIELHAFHFDALMGGSAYPFHRGDDSFENYLKEVTEQTGDKVRCDISATLRYSDLNQQVVLTNGLCEFDLTTVRQ